MNHDPAERAMKSHGTTYEVSEMKTRKVDMKGYQPSVVTYSYIDPSKKVIVEIPIEDSERDESKKATMRSVSDIAAHQILQNDQLNESNLSWKHLTILG
jgi:hypothetical protein